MSYTATPRQTLLDIAVQLYGSPDGLPAISEINGQAFTGLPSSAEIEHDATEGAVAAYLRKQAITIATHEVAQIGVMIIGTTFQIRVV